MLLRSGNMPATSLRRRISRSRRSCGSLDRIWSQWVTGKVEDAAPAWVKMVSTSVAPNGWVDVGTRQRVSHEVRAAPLPSRAGEHGLGW